MQQDRWEDIQRLFLHAADLPPEEVPGFLDHSCGGDPGLRDEVESLLLADREPLEKISAAVEGEATHLVDGEILLGERLGDYRVVRQIGRGGMGSVFLAIRDDDQYRKQVAIKVVRRGMDSADVLGRFRR